MARLAKTGRAAPLKPLKLPPIARATLPNGLQVVVARRGPLPLVAIRLLIQAGSCADPVDRHGIVDFTARLLRRGTQALSADQISESVEFVGGSLAAGATEDFIAVSMSAPAEHLSALLDVLGQVVRAPAFPPAEVESARGRTLAQLANDLDDPAALADRAFLQAVWGDHPYGHDVSGNAAHVRTYAREDLVRTHAERWGPRISSLIVVGQVEPDAVFAAAERARGGWSGGPEAPVVPPPLARPAMAGHVVVVDKPDQSQTQVRIGGTGVEKGHPAYFPIVAFNTVLGGGFTSRLVTEIRVKRGLSYGAGSHFDARRAGGDFSVSTFTKTESTRKVIDVVLAEIERMRRRGPTPAELRTAQRYVGALYPTRFETNEALSAGLAEQLVYGLPDDWIERFRERLSAVTRAQAAEAARNHLFESEPVLVLVANASALGRQLEGLGPVTVRQASELE